MNKKTISQLKQEFEFNLNSLLESVSVDIDDASEGLKVKHIASGLLYTVKSISKKDVTLTTPEGKDMIINADKFEKNYEV
jgi:hypothetical protein